MPESVTDRPTKSHEQIFLLTKRARYFYDTIAVQEESVDMAGWQSRMKYKLSGSRDGAHPPNDNRYAPKGFREVPSDGATRNRRSVWTIATKPYSGAHFATFPPDLIIPCIQAGTSERGVCAACGAQWERCVEKELTGVDERRPNNLMPGRSGKGFTRMRAGDSQSTTTGWQPTCNCPPSDPIPATVLDPFGGSGTTAQVSRQLNRHTILIELNPEYAELAKVRVLQRLDGEDDLLPLFDRGDA